MGRILSNDGLLIAAVICVVNIPVPLFHIKVCGEVLVLQQHILLSHNLLKDKN